MNISKMLLEHGYLIKQGYNDCIQNINLNEFCKLKFGTVGSYKSSTFLNIQDLF